MKKFVMFVALLVSSHVVLADNPNAREVGICLAGVNPTYATPIIMKLRYQNAQRKNLDAQGSTGSLQMDIARTDEQLSQLIKATSNLFARVNQYGTNRTINDAQFGGNIRSAHMEAASLFSQHEMSFDDWAQLYDICASEF